MPFRPNLAAIPCLLFGLVGATTIFSQCSGDERQLAAVQDPQAPPAVPAPDDAVRFLVSGSMLGRLEPCGCASGQLGGLARRMQHVGESRSYDVLIEGGDLVEGATELDLMKWYTAIQVLFQMEKQYHALGVGPKDLELPLDEWCALIGETPVVASDLESSRPDWPAKPFVEKDTKKHKVRIASLTTALPAKLQGADSQVKLLAPADAWKRALTGIAPDTLRVLLVHTDENTAPALIPQLHPAPDLVICFDHGYVEPSPAARRVGDVPLLVAGIRGRVLLEVALQRMPGAPPRVACSLVPLAGSKTLPGGGGDPTVKEVLLAHRNEVKEKEILEKLARQKPTPSGAAYIGSESCRVCHPTAWTAFEKTRHFHAWDTLVKAESDPKRYGWPVTAYPDCVSCHVVGYGEQTGFVTFEMTPQLAAVGCERCHGPGSDHVKTNGATKLGIHGGVQASILCTQCHDFEQSPDFLYGNKWPLIQHGREPAQRGTAPAEKK